MQFFKTLKPKNYEFTVSNLKNVSFENTVIYLQNLFINIY